MKNRDNKRKEIHEAILNDRVIQGLQNEKMRIYIHSPTKIILKENGEIETTWINQTNRAILKNIEQEIESRQDQISKFYSKDINTLKTNTSVK